MLSLGLLPVDDDGATVGVTVATAVGVAVAVGVELAVGVDVAVEPPTVKVITSLADFA